MSDLLEPLINTPGYHPGMKTIKDFHTSEVDSTFYKIQNELESFFKSKEILLPIDGHLMYLSQQQRKLYIYSDSKILTYCLDTNTILSVNDVGILLGTSITGNSLGLYLATSNAEMFQLKYDSFDVIRKVVIGKKALYVSCHSDEGV